MINNGKDFIVLDIETTGLSPKTEEIIEIAAIKVDGQTLKVKESIEFLVDSGKWIPQFIIQLTGITNSMIEEAGIPLGAALNLLSDFAKDLNVFAHYSPFDKEFIRTKLDDTATSYQKSKWFDTIDLFKEKWPERYTYKLESLIKDFDLAKKEDHRALSDAMHTLTLMKKTQE